MTGAIQIARFAGIPVRLHWTFSLLLIWIIYVGLSEGMAWHSIAWLGAFTLLLFCCVIMHEYGHALTARKYGVRTKDIVILPIGGVARLEKLPDKPLQELLIAIAGPAVNIGIAFFTGLILWITGDYQSLVGLGNLESLLNLNGMLALLFVLNITLFLFNLIPAFPMDGGRVLRSLLAIKWGRKRATRIASVAGQFIALLFIVYGIFNGHLSLTLIGVFIFFTATAENRAVQMESDLSRYSVRQVFRSQFTRLHPWDTMQKAIDITFRGTEQSFLVFNAIGEIDGVLANDDVLRAIKEQNMYDPVKDWMKKGYMIVDPDDDISKVWFAFQQNQYSILPVVEDEKLIGVLDKSALDNLLKIDRNLS